MNPVPLTHILALTRIRRARLLSIRGQVHVRNGQKISATDIIASGNPGNGHLLLDIRRALNLNRPEQLENILQRKAGDRLQKDDIIAETGGLFKRVMRAPAAGQIVAISGGQILLEIESKPVEIMAGMAGIVIDVIPERGAILEADGALIQGVWGNGKTGQGMLLDVARSPEETFTRQCLDVSMRGAVVLGGKCSDPDALKVGNDLPLRGLILGSMTADLIPTAKNAAYPIILTEGFGSIPMNAQAYKILSTNEKRDTCLNAPVWDPFSGERPEVTIPLPASGETAQETGEIEVGKTVRVIQIPHVGKVGVVTALLPEPLVFPSGLRAPAAAIRLENDEQVSIPLMNLDVLE